MSQPGRQNLIISCEVQGTVLTQSIEIRIVNESVTW